VDRSDGRCPRRGRSRAKRIRGAMRWPVPTTPRLEAKWRGPRLTTRAKFVTHFFSQPLEFFELSVPDLSATQSLRECHPTSRSFHDDHASLGDGPAWFQAERAMRTHGGIVRGHLDTFVGADNPRVGQFAATIVLATVCPYSTPRHTHLTNRPVIWKRRPIFRP